LSLDARELSPTLVGRIVHAGVEARSFERAAIVMKRTGLSLTEALATLRNAHDSVREAVGEDAEPRLRVLLGLDRTPDKVEKTDKSEKSENK